MRPLEITLLALLLMALPLALWRERAAAALLLRVAFGGAIVVTLGHLVLEGGRWQMFPAYALAGVLLLMTLWHWRRGQRPPAGRLRRFAAALPLLLLWPLAAALPWLLPVPRLPAPDGPFAVGSTTFHLVDASRAEIYSAEPGAVRELMLQLWYPAAPAAAGERAPYIDRVDLAAPVLATSLGLPSFALDHLALTRPNAVLDATPLAGEPYPIVVFSHGIAVGFRSQNTLQMEALASQGYVVAAVDHTFGGAFTVLPGERVILYAREQIFPSGRTSAREATPLVASWAADQAALIDFLAALNAGEGPDDRFSGLLALDRVGVYGHSTGGGAAAQFCAGDSRCAAVALLDGWVEPTADAVIAAGLDRPVLALSTAGWLGPENAARGEALLAASTAQTYDIRIAGAAHYDFSDLPLLSPLTPALGLSGELDGPYTTAIVRRYLLAFFDTYLKDIPDPLLATPQPPYPEVTVRRGG